MYLVIGTQKAGTTSLYGILKDHPGLNCAKKKETKFFYKNELYQKGLDDYRNTFFDTSKNKAPYLDVDPDNMYFEFIPERIAKTLGEQARFIVILRDPARRAYSHYTMEKFRKKETLSFQQAIREEPGRILQEEGNFYHAYINRGRYIDQIERYLQYFPIEFFQFYVFEEDFIEKREEMIRSICAFMGLEFDDSLSLDIQTNQSRVIRSRSADHFFREKNLIKSMLKNLLPLAIRRKLRSKVLMLNSAPQGVDQLSEASRSWLIKQFFSEDIQRLEQLINRDLSIWKAT